MERKRVNSSQIRSIGYAPSRQSLEIEFSNGSILEYASVSPEVHRRLMAAPSIMSCYRDTIEDEFTFQRIR